MVFKRLANSLAALTTLFLAPGCAGAQKQKQKDRASMAKPAGISIEAITSCSYGSKMKSAVAQKAFKV